MTTTCVRKPDTPCTTWRRSVMAEQKEIGYVERGLNERKLLWYSVPLWDEEDKKKRTTLISTAPPIIITFINIVVSSTNSMSARAR